MEQEEQLSKKEKKQLKRQEKFDAREAFTKKRRLKKIALWGLGGAISVAVIAGLVWLIASRPQVEESDIVSRNGMHWHPELAIYVKGQKQEIPENIGIGAVHQPIHTHDDSDLGIIHMEFSGRVLKQETTLGQFFKNWGKDMRSFGENMRMTVNGRENIEYENYLMHDGDKIELHYE